MLRVNTLYYPFDRRRARVRVPLFEKTSERMIGTRVGLRGDQRMLCSFKGRTRIRVRENPWFLRFWESKSTVMWSTSEHPVNSKVHSTRFLCLFRHPLTYSFDSRHPTHSESHSNWFYAQNPKLIFFTEKNPMLVLIRVIPLTAEGDRLWGSKIAHSHKVKLTR